MKARPCPLPTHPGLTVNECAFLDFLAKLAVAEALCEAKAAAPAGAPVLACPSSSADERSDDDDGA